MKIFDYNKNLVSVKYKDIKFICEVDETIPKSIYNKFPVIKNNMLNEYHTFDNPGVLTYFKNCDYLLDYNEYNKKDITELYNIIDFLNSKYDTLNSMYGDKYSKVLSYNIIELKELITEKENTKTYKIK